MSFFTPSKFQAVIRGNWLAHADRRLEMTGIGIDTREDLTGKVFFAIRGENHHGHDYLAKAIDAGAAMLVIEDEDKAIDFPEHIGVLCVPDTIKALGELARAYRKTLSTARVIGITGSAGKTTTKTLVDSILGQVLRGTAAPKSFNNEIGVPLTILSAHEFDKYLITEIGTNAPGEIAKLAEIVHPDIAIITMIGQGHLEGFSCVENVAREKVALLQFLQGESMAIVNADTCDLSLIRKMARRVVTFGVCGEADLRLTDRGQDENGWWFEVNGRQRYPISLPGAHNAINALAAIAVARRMGIEDQVIAKGLGSAAAEPMRMTRLQIGDLVIDNDAYNANPDSMRAALETFSELNRKAPRRIAVLGDMLELGSASKSLHHELGQFIDQHNRELKIDYVVTIGTAASHIAQALESSLPEDRLVKLKSLNPRSAKRLYNLLQPGDAVLLKGSRGMALERLEEFFTQFHKKTPLVISVGKKKKTRKKVVKRKKTRSTKVSS